jgi:hypothetical protein
VTALKKILPLFFTGDEFTDGAEYITGTLEKEKIRASFFFTRRPYEDRKNENWIRRLVKRRTFPGESFL